MDKVPLMNQLASMVEEFEAGQNVPDLEKIGGLMRAMVSELIETRCNFQDDDERILRLEEQVSDHDIFLEDLDFTSSSWQTVRKQTKKQILANLKGFLQAAQELTNSVAPASENDSVIELDADWYEKINQPVKKHQRQESDPDKNQILRAACLSEKVSTLFNTHRDEVDEETAECMENKLIEAIELIHSGDTARIKRGCQFLRALKRRILYQPRTQSKSRPFDADDDGNSQGRKATDQYEESEYGL